MDNKKKLLIGGGIVAAIILLIVLVLVFCGDDSKDEKTTSEQSTSESIEENTTSKDMAENDTTQATEDESSAENVEESTDEETTSIAEEDSSEEEVTTKTAADAGKDTTSKKETASKKEDKTTKKNETTTKKQTSKETTNKKQTTTAKQTTTKQDITTQEQTTAKPKPQSGRIKECELALVDACYSYYPDNVNEGSIYTHIEDGFNPFLMLKNEFGWENVAISYDTSEFAESEYYEGDYFAIKYPNDEFKQFVIRDMYFSRKYNQAIIDDFNLWVQGSSEYDSAEEFGQYLRARYLGPGENSIFSTNNRVNPEGSSDDMYEGLKKEWCEQWCYFDTQLQKYRTKFRPYYSFGAITFEEDGYYTNVEKIYEQLKSENRIFTNPGGIWCRWIYDAKTDKTVIYLVCAI